MDTTKVGLAAAKLMEILEKEYPGGEVKEVGIVAEVRLPSEDGEEIKTPTYCTNDSRIYQDGLWDWAQDVANHGEPPELGE